KLPTIHTLIQRSIKQNLQIKLVIQKLQNYLLLFTFCIKDTAYKHLQKVMKGAQQKGIWFQNFVWKSRRGH
ncbi:hypothetical protein Leryth_001335, partial [Lithospermum erythrorhizon]